MLRPVALALLASLLAAPTRADGLRIATYDVGLARDGPGLLLHELATEPKPATRAVAAVIRAARPDILLLTGFDQDFRGRALDAFRALLARGEDGVDYPHAFAPPGNEGVPSGLDLDDDGRSMGRGDAFGWGRFPGNGGMALLSRLPLDPADARSFAALRWAALPGADLPLRPDGSAFPDPARQAALRLSSRSHWDVPVLLPDGTRLHLLAANPTPPLFDGPEGVNRRRNADEIRFWSAYLDGAAFADDQGRTAPGSDGPLVLLGNLNLDPFDGRGDHAAIAALLAHPRLRDPRPESPGAAAAATRGHAGEAALDTADWKEDGPGNLRTDYVLPSAELRVTAAGVLWPAPGDAFADTAAATPHRLVWVDLALP
jgi:hypothetical protein